MFEEVRRLIVDLEGVVRVESIEIEQYRIIHWQSVLQTTTDHQPSRPHS